MKKKHWVAALLVLGLSVMATLAAIDQKPDLQLALSVLKQATVTGEDGQPKIEWQEVQSTGPRDVLQYTIVYENKGNGEARAAKIVDPIPPNTSYISGSAQGESSAIEFSLDGKSFQPPTLLKFNVKQADGTEVEHVATPDMYTHIQWTLTKPVPSNGKGSLSFQVMVK
jgi:uncharacterized repeat protein (TIGR01451 family)